MLLTLICYSEEIIQRVSSSPATIDGSIFSIDMDYLYCLLQKKIVRMTVLSCNRLYQMRIFGDAEGDEFKCWILKVEVMVVSQFTLFAQTKATGPSFICASQTDSNIPPLYRFFLHTWNG